MLIYSIGVVLGRFVRTLIALLRKPEARGLVILTGLIISAGVLFYRFVEGMTWVDALYFTVITLTTVGYGDISPQTDAGKLFTVVYVLVGLGIIASFIALIADHQREISGRRMGRQDADPPDTTKDSE